MLRHVAMVHCTQPRSHLRTWDMGIEAVSVLMEPVLLVHVAANSLPGDPLYPVKRLEQQLVVVQTHNQEEKVTLEITHLSSALADLSTVVQEGRSDADITAALAVVASDTQDSQQAVNIFPAGQSHETLVQALTSAVNNERSVLLRLLPRLRWSQQIAFTKQLGHVGEQIPLVTDVTITRNGNYTLLIAITGKNFVSGTHLTIAEAPRGIVIQQTSTMLKIVVNAADLPDTSAYSAGVANPDGTVTKMSLPRDHNHPDRGIPGNRLSRDNALPNNGDEHLYGKR
jgi:hypothetical protein